MTSNHIVNWVRDQRRQVFGGHDLTCDYCGERTLRVYLKNVLVALPWLSDRQGKLVLTRLERNLKPKTKSITDEGLMNELAALLEKFDCYPEAVSE